MSFAEYVQAGWSLCRIKPGTKGPSGDDWQRQENGVRDPAVANGLMSAGLCHAWSGTGALDVDNWDVAAPFLLAAGIDLDAMFSAPDAVQISSGRQGRGKLLFKLSAPLPTIKLAAYKAPSKKDPAILQTYHALELRCATAGGLSMQDVLPPSIHPETCQPYVWIYGDPVTGHWSDLPPLPAALEALWRGQLQPAADVSAPAKTSRGASVDEMKALIASEDPDDFDNWIRIGQILHHETEGSGVGFSLWDTWSRQSDKYSDGKTRAWDRWNGFGQNDGTGIAATIGSLIQNRVAAPTEFGIAEETPEAVGVDTRAVSEIEAVLKPRIVYLLDQERFYHRPLTAKDPGYTAALDQIGAQALKPVAFDILYAPFMPMVMDGDKAKVADARQAVRRSRNIDKVNAVSFHPGAGRIFADSDGSRYLNEFEAVPVTPLRPKPAELDAWNFLCSRIEHNLFRSWLLKFFAHMLAKPGVKIQSAPLLVSDTQGTGKTTWMQTIPRHLFGDRWVREVSSEMIASTFNSFLASTWWVAIEELKTDGPRMNRIAIANKLKPWITSATLPIEFKGVNTYNIANRMQVGGSSNFRDTLQLDNSDRRWGIARVVEHQMTASEKTSLFNDLLSTPRASGVLHYLIRQENLTGFSPTAEPPQTEEKRSMIQVGMGPHEVALAEQMVDQKAPFDRDIVSCEDVQEVLRTHNLHLSRKRVGMLLRKVPFCGQPKSTGKTILYCWRNWDKWQQMSGAEWESHRETGIRHEAVWDYRVPVAIRNVAGEDESPDDLSDLLGAI